MNTAYNDLKQAHRSEVNSFFGIFFAFNNKQFDEGMKKVGLNKEDTSKIANLGSGGFILKSRIPAFRDILKRHDQERKQLQKNKKELLKALIYELKNHEYCITRNPDSALEVLGLEKENLPKGMLNKACKLALVGVNY